MPATKDDNKELLTVRVPTRLMARVRKIAADEQESQALIVRRLLRDGLDRRDATQGDAA